MKINQLLLVPWILSGLYILVTVGSGIPAVLAGGTSLSPNDEGYLMIGLLAFFVAYTVFLACLFRDELRAAFHIRHKHHR